MEQITVNFYGPTGIQNEETLRGPKLVGTVRSRTSGWIITVRCYDADGKPLWVRGITGYASHTWTANSE